MWRWLIVVGLVACRSAPAEPLDTPTQRLRPRMATTPVRPSRLFMPIDTVVDATTPAAPPVVRIDKRGGFGGKGGGGFSVWSDGTVQFRGPQCEAARRGTVDATRVRELIVQLEDSGLLVRKDKPIDHGCGYMLDGFYWDIALRSAEHTNQFHGPDTTPQRTCVWVEDMLDTIHTVIGANPCAE